MNKFVALMSASALCAAAQAQVSGIGPFTGDEFESFDQYAFGLFVPQLANAFNGTAVFNGSALHVTSGWGFFCSVSAFSAPKMMASAGGGPVEWLFNTPATKVGGYFSTNADVPGATIRFYDESNNLLAEVGAEVPLCQWQWNGWEATGAPIKRIEVISTNQFGGFIMHDDLQVTYGGGTSCYADCDLSGSLDFFDFLCFQNEFAAGCP